MINLEDGEEIKDVLHYEGIYAITNFGRIWRYDMKVSGRNGASRKLKGRWLKTKNVLSLSKDNKVYYCTIKRLVAQHFVPNPFNLPDVTRIDKNITNNHACNLKWVEESKSKSKKVKCLNTGQIFESMAAACRWAGFKTKNNLAVYFKYKYILCGKHPATGEKLRWELIEEVQNANN